LAREFGPQGIHVSHAIIDGTFLFDVSYFLCYPRFPFLSLSTDDQGGLSNFAFRFDRYGKDTRNDGFRRTRFCTNNFFSLSLKVLRR